MKGLVAISSALVSMAAIAEEALPKASASAYQGPDIAGMLGAFMLVLAAPFIVSFVMRRSKLVSAPNQAGVNVIAQLPLSMKEKLLVVQVGDERLLLGATTASINTLHCWKADAPPPAEVQQSFGSLLAGKLAALKGVGNTGGEK